MIPSLTALYRVKLSFTTRPNAYCSKNADYNDSLHTILTRQSKTYMSLHLQGYIDLLKTHILAMP